MGIFIEANKTVMKMITITPDITLEESKQLLKIATANTKHMAKFVLSHPDLFSEWSIEESKKQLKEIEKNSDIN